MPNAFENKDLAAAAGRKSGKPKISKQWEALSVDIIGKHSDRFNYNLDNASDDDFNELYLKILKWFKPQLSNTSLDITSDGEQLTVLTSNEIIERLNRIITQAEES